MDMSFEEMVRERAYHIWLAGGMAEGMEHEHWAMAEQAVQADPAPVVILTKPAKPAAKSVAKVASAKKPTVKSAKPAAKTAKKAKADVAASL